MPHPTAATHRHLPHWHTHGAIYWVTFRLADALPHAKLQQLAAAKEEWLHCHPEPWTPAQKTEFDAAFSSSIEAWLDAGQGSCHLRKPDIREIVSQSLLRFDGDRVNVHAAIIMPNHVHALLQPIDNHTLSALLKGIKGASARLANQALARSGAFWQDESYDHIVRDENEYQRLLTYIRENPTSAPLAPDQYWLHLPPGHAFLPLSP